MVSEQTRFVGPVEQHDDVKSQSSGPGPSFWTWVCRNWVKSSHPGYSLTSSEDRRFWWDRTELGVWGAMVLVGEPLVQRFGSVPLLVQAALAALHHVDEVGERLLLVHRDVPEVTAHRLHTNKHVVLT